MHLESKKGQNISVNGQPALRLGKVGTGSLIKLHPYDFPGINPKLLISKDESVVKGQPIYFDKKIIIYILSSN